VWLDLSSNQLSGELPPEFGGVVSNSSCSGCFSYLDLRFNQLSGTVPLPVARAATMGILGCYLTDNDPGLCVPDIPAYQELGDPICGLGLDAGCQAVVHVEAKVFLEGAHSGSGMHSLPGFSIHRPDVQPYSAASFDGTPSSYHGGETMDSSVDSVLDWVLVNLRSGTAAETEIAGSMRAALLRTDGSVVDTSGGILAFRGVSPEGYYVVLRHRNHVSVMSADTLDLSDGIGSWDFTSSMSQAFTDGGDPMKSLGGGVYGMFACDANVDDQITAPDFNLWNASTTAGMTGYVQADCNMDGQVTAPDFNLWNANTTSGAGSKVPQ
jgi:hypothetical protein